MVSRIIQVPSFDLVVFGATGDLARRKIFPALYGRLLAGQMPSNAKVIGIARQEMPTNKFRALVRKSLEVHFQLSSLSDKLINSFLQCFVYVSVDANSDKNWDLVRNELRSDKIRAFYLSVAPELFDKLAAKIFAKGLSTQNSRIVVEKPLGSNEKSAKALNGMLGNYFNEGQIYRIDHYLGKETVQNLMALRFSNVLFEPLWNSKFIDHVQITVSEKIGVQGRGAYYNKTGALKDMVQNHIMQLLCLTAMEPPSQFVSDLVHDEKLKVIKSLGAVSAMDIVTGQYWENSSENYFADVGDQHSNVESYVALKVSVNNLRWSGTPFYLRTGKKMKNQVSEIAIIFKEISHSIFDDQKAKARNKLIIRLQPNDGITLKTNIKDPGLGGMRITSVPLDMTFAEALDINRYKVANAYERLIMDVIRGDQTLFMRGDEVEEAWKWIDKIRSQISSNQIPDRYASYSSGPKSSDLLLKRDGRKWRAIK